MKYCFASVLIRKEVIKNLMKLFLKKNLCKNLGQNPEESFEFNQTLELLSQIDTPNTPLPPTQNINVGSASATLPNPNLK